MSTKLPRHLVDEPMTDLRTPSDDAYESRAPENDSEATEALVTLHQRTVDALKGYAKMVEKAEPEFRNTAERFRSLHAANAARMSRILARLGHPVSDDASMMGNLNEAVVAFRAFVDQIDEDVMDQIRDGEDWILAAFDDAVASRQDAVRAELFEMRAELVKLLDETSHIG